MGRMDRRGEQGGEGEVGLGAMGRGRGVGDVEGEIGRGQRRVGEAGRGNGEGRQGGGQREGETERGQRQWEEEGTREGGILQMHMMECLGGQRL